MTMRRDTYRHGDLRRAAVRASIELIETEGLEALSLREVARRLGVTHAAPYHHFPDRAALLRAVAEEGFETLTREMSRERDAAEEPLGRLAGCGVGYVAFAVANPGVFRVMFRPELTGIQGEAVPPIVLESWNILSAAASACQEAGLAPRVPTQLLATLCWSAVHGLASLWLDRPLRAGPGRGPGSARDLAVAVTGLLSSLLAAGGRERGEVASSAPTPRGAGRRSRGASGR